MSGSKKSWQKFLSGHYTLMLIPHSQESAYNIRVPALMIVIGLVILFIVGGYGYYFVSDYRAMKIEHIELQTLRLANEKQQRQLQGLKVQTAKLKEKLPQLNLLQQNVLKIIDRAEREKRGDILSRSSRRISRNDVTSRGKQPEDNVGEFAVSQWLSAAETWSQQYYDLQNNLQSLSTEFDNAATRLSDQKPQLVEAIDFLKAVPSGWPVEGRITSPYGNRRSPYSSRREFHSGLDIAVPYGTMVKATASGVVEFAGYQRVLGRMVKVKSQYGFTTVYGHNSKLLVKQGDVISQGDSIAKVGSTGRSTGPHVHYEVFVNGSRVDPTDYLGE
ncbi:M23 family metallopeptidase [Metallumcola ferriviriculae]|uniref:M23 family metallopeptidase n=1 Tax=Metallumcola ferriviriculae TaxID=3039180 RepID=A0AAU0ULM5_9FIRM|nr:M23 family metallopeptidase [Desulfitibacteraceae bacterium MK1]